MNRNMPTVARIISMIIMAEALCLLRRRYQPDNETEFTLGTPDRLEISTECNLFLNAFGVRKLGL